MCTSVEMHQATNVNESQVNRRLFNNIKSSTVEQCGQTLPVFICMVIFVLLLISGPEGQDVLLVAIPEFSSTQTACLVNLRTLECEPVCFSSFSTEDDEDSEMNISH